MNAKTSLPLPKLDALPLGAHRLLRREVATIPVLTDETLFEACGVRIAFTSREGGVSEGPYAKLNCALHVEDDEQAVLRNRQIVLGALGVPDAQLIVPNQVHGTNIVCVGEPAAASSAAASSTAVSDAETPTLPAVANPAAPIANATDLGMASHAVAVAVSPAIPVATNLINSAAGKALNVSAALEEVVKGADAVVVGMPEVAALLNYADCLPLIIVAPSGSFAVVHAGWRGAVAHIAAKATLELAAQTGENPIQFNAYIGPHIRSECFEVSVEVAELFAAEFNASVVEGKRHVSLSRAVACDLETAGMSPQRIADCGICTKCNPDQYFSYRATNGRCGRHSAAAVRHVC